MGGILSSFPMEANLALMMIVQAKARGSCDLPRVTCSPSSFDHNDISPPSGKARRLGEGERLNGGLVIQIKTS